MKRLFAVCALVCAAIVRVHAQDDCSPPPITVDQSPRDIHVPKHCLDQKYKLKWKTSNSGAPWSAIFSPVKGAPKTVSVTPCDEKDNTGQSQRTHFGSNPDNDGKKHDTCTISWANGTSGTTNCPTCPAGDTCYCYHWDYYPNDQGKGQSSDPEVIVDSSMRDGMPPGRKKSAKK